MFVCNSIEYLFAADAELDSFGTIVPKDGYAFSEISSSEKNTYKEKGRSSDGNILYEQTLNAEYKFSDIKTVQSFNNQHFILRLQKPDGSYFCWGSLEPYNPVQVNMSLSEGIASLEFYRNSEMPEN